MRTTELGGSGIEVPGVCLGTMFFGTRVDEATSFDVLDHALERGATFWDTANNYAAWLEGRTGDESESLLGRWFASRPASLTDQVVLATKLGARAAPGTQGFENKLGLSAAAIRPQIEDSLRRLGRDHVDLLYAHIDDHDTPLEETVGALGEIVEAGLARAVGASNLTGDRLQQAIKLAGDGPGRYVALQQRMTYLRPTPDADFGVQIALDDATEAIAAELEVTVLAYSALLTGAYDRDDRPVLPEYQTPDTARGLLAIRSAASRTGLAPGQVVLAWLMARRPPIIPVLGVSTRDQLEDALDAADIDLGDEIGPLDAARGAQA